MVFAYFDFKNGLYELLESIASKTDTGIQVVFQHPSPSPESKQSISSAGYACAKAILDSLIFRVDFAFDYNHHEIPGMSTLFLIRFWPTAHWKFLS